MDLGKHVVDKEILDRRGLRIGRVDDLLLDMGERLPDGTLPAPAVACILTGPMALSAVMSRPMRWLARQAYHVLGLSNPHPFEIPWSSVTEIGVAVHVDVDRNDIGTSALEKAAEKRYIRRLPGS